MWRRPTESGISIFFNIPPTCFFVKSIKINIVQNKKPGLSVRKEQPVGYQHKSGKSICIVRKNRTRTSASEEDFNNFLTERGCPKSNERYTKFGVFDKLNHRNANLLDSPMTSFLFFYRLLIILFAIFVPIS